RSCPIRAPRQATQWWHGWPPGGPFQLPIPSVDLDDSRRSADHGERRFALWCRRRLVRLREAMQRVLVHLACEIVLGRRRGAAMQPYQDAQQGVGEAVSLLPRRDEVHILEPRQIVL